MKTLETRVETLERDMLSLKGVNKKKSVLLEESQKVLEFLNEKTEKKFKPIESNLKHISARLKEGYGTEDLSKVVSLKALDEFFQKDNFKFMRPSTLFNSAKFENYYQEMLLYEKDNK